VDLCILAKPTGLWANYHCDHQMGFICEMPAGFEAPTTLDPPTDAPDIDCHDGQSDGWIRRPGNLCPMEQRIFA